MRCDNYRDFFTKDYLMGPNSLRLLDEMLEKYPLKEGSRIMDLGCGMGITSMFLAKEAKVNVFATDLWISATQNAENFKKWNVDDRIIPIHADANDLPYAHEYFDAIVSIDAFHYFAAKKGFFEEKILPFIKKDGVLVVAMPGLKEELTEEQADIMLEWFEGNRDDAIHAYKSVIRMAPSNEMDFNARIRMAELGGKISIKKLRTMTKQSKYKDKLDQIYGAMGNIYLANRDTAKALDMYEKAIAEATQAGSSKADVLVRAGDLYYEVRAYPQAQPCYREAINILTADNPTYIRIRKRSEVLDELILAYTQMQLQDSLQRLSTKSEQEQRVIVDKIIADLIASEKADSTKQADEAREIARDGMKPRSVNTANMLGAGAFQKGEWYFYNQQLIKQGQQEWRRRWGSRALEDNWRRQNKQVSVAFDEETYNEETDSAMLASDSIKQPQQAYETDIHKPEYYLQQIPRTPQQMEVSDSLLRQAMVDLYYIYRDKVEDDQLAAEILRELEERFAGHPSLATIYEEQQLRALRNNPEYIARMRCMLAEQDSLYEATYVAYTHGRFKEVKTNKQYAETNFPQSELMPRFLFLNAVSVARTEKQDAFVKELQHIVEAYGETEIGAMAKDMLAMMGQGMESKKGGSTATLADKRGQVTQEQPEQEEQTQQWSNDRKQASVVLLRMKQADEQALNELLYEVALFNFSQFLIRDFELQKMPILGEGCALRVSGFADMDEADWWIGLVRKDAHMQAVLIGIDVLPVAEVNLPLVK